MNSFEKLKSKKWKLLIGLILLIVLGNIVFGQRLNVFEVTLISKDIAWTTPAFSPDGTQIAYYRKDTITLMDLNGQIQGEFFSENVSSNLHWLTPSEIIFARWLEDEIIDGNEDSQFWVLNIQSGHTYPMNDDILSPRIEYISLSPDRTKLAFVQPSDEFNLTIPHTSRLIRELTIHVMDLTTGKTSQLLAPVSGHCFSPTWHNEIEVIAICSDQKTNDDEWDFQVWNLNVVTGESKLLQSQDDLFSPSAAPDGKWLIYNCWEDTWPPTGNLCAVPLTYGKPIFIRSHRLNLLDNFLLTSLQTVFEMPPTNVAWSPDSKSIVFSGNMRTKNDEFKQGIWYVTFD